jgi:hypothetical protein
MAGYRRSLSNEYHTFQAFLTGLPEAIREGALLLVLSSIAINICKAAELISPTR